MQTNEIYMMFNVYYWMAMGIDWSWAWNWARDLLEPEPESDLEPEPAMWVRKLQHITNV